MRAGPRCPANPRPVAKLRTGVSLCHRARAVLHLPSLARRLLRAHHRSALNRWCDRSWSRALLLRRLPAVLRKLDPSIPGRRVTLIGVN